MTPLAYLKAGGLALLAVGMFTGALVVRSWHQKALRVDAAEAHAKEIEQVARQAIAAMQAAQEASQKASEDHQNELAKLRAARKPAPVVRLCRDPGVPAPDQGGRGRSSAAPGAGELPQEAGRDIGPDLYGLADDADELAARLRACQKLLR